MTARDIKNWLEGLTEEELDYPVFAGEPNAEGEYQLVEKLSINNTDAGEKAVFMEPLPDEEETAEEVKEEA